MSWIIYKHTSPSGKVYIGQTNRSVNERWRNGNGYKGNTRFFKAILKYGFENFKHEILKDNIQSQKEANDLEIYYISYYKSFDFNYGYNMSPGGYLLSQDQKKKARETFAKQQRNKTRFIVCYELLRVFPNPYLAFDWFISNGYNTNAKKNPIVRVLNKENATYFGFHFCDINKFLILSHENKKK